MKLLPASERLEFKPTQREQPMIIGKCLNSGPFTGIGPKKP